MLSHWLLLPLPLLLLLLLCELVLVPHKLRRKTGFSLSRFVSVCWLRIGSGARDEVSCKDLARGIKRVSCLVWKVESSNLCACVWILEKKIVLCLCVGVIVLFALWMTFCCASLSQPMSRRSGRRGASAPGTASRPKGGGSDAVIATADKQNHPRSTNCSTR